LPGSIDLRGALGTVEVADSEQDSAPMSRSPRPSAKAWIGHDAGVKPPLSAPGRVAVVVLAFVAWTFLFSAAVGGPVAFPGPAEPGSVGDFRIVYDVLWLTSAGAFALLADRAFGSDSPAIRRVRRALAAIVALGAVAVPVLMVALLIR
jgi:hypothetical protein